ncbi:MAG: N-acetylmuramoyl-L-alanine amidase [Burkholderiales bacterium]
MGLAPCAGSAEDKVVSARVWPGTDYTRLVLESAEPIEYKYFGIPDPQRFVLDLHHVIPGPVKGLATQIAADDPHIKQLRTGFHKPGVYRLVLDLKTEVKPSVFTLKPVGEYGHRLVVDIYPAHPADPLQTLLRQIESQEAATLAADEPDSAAPVKPSLPVSDPPDQSQPKPAPTAEAAVKTPSVGANRLVIIAIDAGHGGEDPGAIGKLKTREKNVTLAIARKLKERIDNEPNMRAALVRDGDYFIPLYQRIHKARKINADLFVSIHADAFVRRDAQGSSVYVLSENGASSAAARWLAQKENQSDLIGGVSLSVGDPHLAQTLLDLSQTATINDSLKLGKAVLSELGEIGSLHKSNVEQAGFAVLKSPDIPSILVETAFISNPGEEKRLRDETYQKKIAASIVAGIKAYLANNPPLARSRVAQNP